MKNSKPKRSPDARPEENATIAQSALVSEEQQRRFLRQPPPDMFASPSQLEAYQGHAAKNGIAITADDLKSFLEQCAGRNGGVEAGFASLDSAELNGRTALWTAYAKYNEDAYRAFRGDAPRERQRQPERSVGVIDLKDSDDQTVRLVKHWDDVETHRIDDLIVPSVEYAATSAEGLRAAKLAAFRQARDEMHQVEFKLENGRYVVANLSLEMLRDRGSGVLSESRGVRFGPGTKTYDGPPPNPRQQAPSTVGTVLSDKAATALGLEYRGPQAPAKRETAAQNAPSNPATTSITADRFDALKLAEAGPQTKEPGFFAQRAYRKEFLKQPPPPKDASFAALENYRQAARQAGYKISADDLRWQQEQLAPATTPRGEYAAVTIGADRNASKGRKLLVELTEKHHPESPKFKGEVNRERLGGPPVRLPPPPASVRDSFAEFDLSPRQPPAKATASPTVAKKRG